jgi:bis(5'-adenosyl)-triphosphatase
MTESRQLYFGEFPIDERQVFYETDNIIGIVNISPILPDHVLVIPKSYKEYGAPQKFYDMAPELIGELYNAVYAIERAIKDNRDITDFNIAMQDGKKAGQSVPHVHVHILPRKGGEFSPPDKVHASIQDADVGPDGDNSSAADSIRIPRRDSEEGMKKMEAEALEYKRWFMELKVGGGKKSYVNELLTSLKDGNHKKSSINLLPSGENIDKLRTKFTNELESKITKGGKKSKAKKTKSKKGKKKGKRTRRSNRK